MPDTYSRSNPESHEDTTLPASLVFAKTLSAVQTEGIIQLERNSLATAPRERAAVLNPLIENIIEQLLTLLVTSPSDIGEQV